MPIFTMSTEQFSVALSTSGSSVFRNIGNGLASVPLLRYPTDPRSISEPLAYHYITNRSILPSSRFTNLIDCVVEDLVIKT